MEQKKTVRIVRWLDGSRREVSIPLEAAVDATTWEVAPDAPLPDPEDESTGVRERDVVSG